jgi:hypothetical protein
MDGNARDGLLTLEGKAAWQPAVHRVWIISAV